MTAIVLDHEEAHEQPGGGQEQQDIEPVESEMDGECDREPQGDEGDGRDGQFAHAAQSLRLAVGAEPAPPAAVIGLRGVLGVCCRHRALR
jgi:hypothetical protein